MAIEGVTKCAVPECTAPLSGPNNLCDGHRLQGLIIRQGKSTIVITAWYAERGDEAGVILLNDFALGDLFEGRRGFEVKLRDQGFYNVRLICTTAELKAARLPKSGKIVGDWSGPWRTQYDWEIGPDEDDDNPENLE